MTAAEREKSPKRAKKTSRFEMAGIHYNTKKRVIKEHSTSFYLSETMLDKLDFVADMKGQSRSVIVDVSLNLTKGGENVELAKIERRFFKKRAKKRAKKAKMLSFAAKNAEFAEKKEQQECLFTRADLANV